MISKKSFAAMIPTNKEVDEWYSLAVELFPKYGLVTKNGICSFMAQGAHESNDFKVLGENLNYSAANLRKVFKNYFPSDASANAVAGKPERIANIVYDDRNPARKNKLGNVKDGDGWRFRGAGVFQLTGYNNQKAFADYVGKDVNGIGDYLRTKRGALESALWFWNTRKIGPVADAGDNDKVSRIVNGGDIGKADRAKKYARNLSVYEASTTISAEAPKTTSFVPLSRRANNDLAKVKNVQKALKIASDGLFGLGTESAVRSWQRINGFTVTGVVTEKQYLKMTS